MVNFILYSFLKLRANCLICETRQDSAIIAATGTGWGVRRVFFVVFEVLSTSFEMHLWSELVVSNRRCQVEADPPQKS